MQVEDQIEVSAAEPPGRSFAATFGSVSPVCSSFSDCQPAKLGIGFSISCFSALIGYADGFIFFVKQPSIQEISVVICSDSRRAFGVSIDTLLHRYIS